MIVIDAKDLIVGRFATVAAKKALLGEEVSVVNCQDAVLTGDKRTVFAKYHQKRSMGIPSKGPFYHRQSDRFVRRIIRGMLPHKQERGRTAFKRLMCFVGVPEALAQEEKISIEAAHIKKLPTLKYVYVKEICKELGGKE